MTVSFVRNIVSKLNRIKLWDPNLNCALHSIDILSQNGWCVCTAEDISNLILVKDSSSKKVLQQFEQIYSDDKILEILEEIIHSFKESRLLKNGRIEMLKDMLIVLKKDINKHYLFCGNIFGICEYLFFNKLGDSLKNSKKYLNLSNIKDLNKKLNNLSKYNFSALKVYSIIKVIKKYWKPNNYNTFCRDTIQHGFFNPQEIQKKDFLRLLLLLKGILGLVNPNSILNIGDSAK